MNWLPCTHNKNSEGGEKGEGKKDVKDEVVWGRWESKMWVGGKETKEEKMKERFVGLWSPNFPPWP